MARSKTRDEEIETVDSEGGSGRKGRGAAGRIYVRHRPERKKRPYEARVDVGGGSKRVQKSFYGASKKEAEDKAKAALRSRDDGLPIPSERLTVGKWLDQWLQDIIKPNRQPLTHTAYESRVRMHIKPALGRFPLKDLTPQQVQRFLNVKAAPRTVNGETVPGLSARMVNELRATLRSALNEALIWGHVHRNVAALTKPRERDDKEVEPLDPVVARSFLEIVKKSRLAALYTVALAIGLRRGEALGLAWEDVDLDGRMLQVRQQLQRHSGGLHLKRLKTRKSRRTIPLPDFAVTSLREHRVRQLEERLAAGAKWHDTGMVFTSTIGTWLDPDNFKRDFTALREAAGVPHFRFHDLRHTCASLLLAQGTDVRTVMEILGHSQIQITQNLYQHVLPVLKRDAADQMDVLFAAAR